MQTFVQHAFRTALVLTVTFGAGSGGGQSPPASPRPVQGEVRIEPEGSEGAYTGFSLLQGDRLVASPRFSTGGIIRARVARIRVVRSMSQTGRHRAGRGWTDSSAPNGSTGLRERLRNSMVVSLDCRRPRWGPAS